MEEELARCGRDEISRERYHAGLGDGPCDGVKPSMIQEHMQLAQIWDILITHQY